MDTKKLLNFATVFIVLEMGSHDIASSLADEWIFWKAGIADYVVIHRNKTYLITLLLIGYFLITVSAILIIRNKNRQLKTDVGHI